MRRTLERLYLDGNGLAELPENLATLRSLRYLTLDGNQLRHVQPATLLAQPHRCVQIPRALSGDVERPQTGAGRRLADGFRVHAAGIPTGLGVSHNRITVKPDFQQSIQVLRVDGNPWLHDDETPNAETSTVAS